MGGKGAEASEEKTRMRNSVITTEDTESTEAGVFDRINRIECAIEE